MNKKRPLVNNIIIVNIVVLSLYYEKNKCNNSHPAFMYF